MEERHIRGTGRANKPQDAMRIKRIYDSYDCIDKVSKKSEMLDKKIRFFDERYLTITKLFMDEIRRRKIDITDPEFSQKMEEILQGIVKGKFFQSRFSNDNIQDVRNAILRRVNKERQTKEENLR